MHGSHLGCRVWDIALLPGPDRVVVQDRLQEGVPERVRRSGRSNTAFNFDVANVQNESGDPKSSQHQVNQPVRSDPAESMSPVIAQMAGFESSATCNTSGESDIPGGVKPCFRTGSFTPHMKGHIHRRGSRWPPART